MHCAMSENWQDHRVMIEVVCGVIRNIDGKVLACRRAADRHLGSLWEFSGGKVEDGEDPRAALARELSEELGIVVKVGEKFDAVVEWSDGVVRIQLSGFLCEIEEGTAESLEHDEIRWCERECAKNLLLGLRPFKEPVARPDCLS
jgi:8-oxo-dGTP diphosphatase